MINLRARFQESIQFKFLTIIFVTMFLMTFAASAFIAKNERDLLRRSLIDKGRSLGGYMAQLSKEPLLSRDFLQLDAIVKEVNRDPEVAYAVVRDAQGNTVTTLYASINFHVPALRSALSTLPKDSGIDESIGALRKHAGVIEQSAPIAMENEVLGSIVLGMSGFTIRGQVVRTALFVVLVNLVAIVLIGFVLYASSRAIILRPIARLTEVSRRIARGEIFHVIESSSRDEIGKLMESFAEMSLYLKSIGETAGEISGGELRKEIARRSESDYLGESFRNMVFGLPGIVSHVRSNADEITAASARLAASAEEASRNTETAATAIEEITATMHEMAANTVMVANNTQSQAGEVNKTSVSVRQLVESIKHVAENVKRLANIARQSRDVVGGGRAAVDRSATGMDKIDNAIRGAADTVTVLVGKIAEIGRIVEVIDDIAEQTNLLSLNAAIEAAKAGEQGLGFAVVADEVRKLAERSAVSTREIGEMIRGIQKDSQGAVKQMDASVRSIQAELEQGRTEVSKTLARIETSVDEVAKYSSEIGATTAEQAIGSDQIIQAMSALKELTEGISASAQEQSAGAEQVASSIEQIRDMIQQNAATSAEVSTSAEQLAVQAKKLRETVGRFRTHDTVEAALAA